MSRSLPGQSNEIDLKRNIPERRVKLAGAPPIKDGALFHSQNPEQGETFD